MNRVALGLAVGAGYVLGRTKKTKLALALGSLVAGKRMQLSPKALAELVNQQLRNNPQFKEIGDQLRQDLRGVGKAASGAVVERQIEGLAERLHGRTDQVREQLSGVVPETSDLSGLHEEEEAEEEEEKGGAESAEARGSGEPSEDEEAPPREAAKKAPAKKRPATQSAGTKAAAKNTATSARKAPTKKAPARKAPAAKGGARRATSGSAGERRR
ncbi:DNA primase [Streptomyces sp. NPDC001156]